MEYKFEPHNIFFTSDTHFYHKNIISFCHRPFKDVEEMNEILIKNWNEVVGLDDTIFHLGDFFMGGSAQLKYLLDHLNGKKYLILGNHDRRNINKSVMHRFEHVTMQMQIRVGKQSIYLNHYPFLCYGGSYANVWQLFGHVHTCQGCEGLDTPRLSMLFPTQYDVGVDNNNYTPISFYQVQQIIETQIENNLLNK